MIKKYKDVIIVDSKNQPMVWDEQDKQLVYCTNDTWEDEHTPVQTYTVKKAKRLIEKTKASRNKWDMSIDNYRTMPFDYPMRKRYIFPNKKINQ